MDWTGLGGWRDGGAWGNGSMISDVNFCEQGCRRFGCNADQPPAVTGGRGANRPKKEGPKYRNCQVW